ncbi:MAG: homocysteine S-methyltransferase family protein, partial [Pseudomonadota bacterium]
ANVKDHPLWGLHVMRERPEILREVHADYFAAGAEVATANTYNAHRDRFANAGEADQFEPLQHLALRLACEARDAAGSGLVAGAMGPLGGSYRPEHARPVEEAAELFAEVAELQKPYVDLFMIETMSSTREAAGALAGVVGQGKPVWLAISVDDEDGTRLRSGEPVEAILPILAGDRPDALLVNCSRPEAVSAALPLLTGWDGPLGAYANGFTGIVDDFKVVNQTVNALTARVDLDPAAYAAFAEGWIAAGATLIGGCCEVGPAHIAELSRRFKAERAA